ncbi:MAG: riboflavin synthase [Candidatus Sumerlaeota bacterium]|nr:riboflavin synthase [Candidatus Sumerlaeota bacterium]
MFTGIVEEFGTIAALRPGRESIELVVDCREALKGIALGDSIAVDGICLTVTAFDDTTYTTLASAETLRRTSLGSKSAGDKVNLERSLTLDKKLGGHLVQGHVDCTARVESITPEGDSQMWRFRLPAGYANYLVPKGSVAVDGISLTVVDVVNDIFSAAIIPKTLEVTTFQFRKPGNLVNIETDIIGKYVYRYLHPDESALDPSATPLGSLNSQPMKG